MSLQSLEGFVLNVMDSRSCFHLVSCSCKMSSGISLLSVCIWSATSCEGSWRLRWFLIRILCLMFLLNPVVKCLIWSLLCLVIRLVICLVVVLMPGNYLC